MNAIPERIAQMFGGARPLGRAPKTVDDWRELVETGIPVAALRNLRHVIASSEDQAEALADVVFETPDRRVRYVVQGQRDPTEPHGSVGGASPHDAQAEKLTGSESERAERIARLYALAEAVLGSADEARTFLFSPHPKLDGEQPIDWMRTEIGGRSVEQLLINVQESFPS